MVLSIDISSSNIYAVEGIYNAGVVNVAKAANILLPGPVVEDGEIKNHAALAMSINKMIAARNISTNKVVFTINSNSILSRRLEMPPSKPKDLGKMIKNEMLQTVNDVGEFVYEYSINNEGLNPNGLIPLWAYAIPRDMVDGYNVLIKNLKMKPLALDVHTNSIEKLFIGSSINGNEYGSKSIILINLEPDSLEIHLFSDKQRAFSRLASVGISNLSMLLGDAKNSDTTISYEEVDINSPKIRENLVVNEIIHTYTNQIADEAQKMIQFQLRRNSANPVCSVYIYGSVSNIVGLDYVLSTLLGIHTEKIVNLSKVKSSAPIEKYINAIGAFIRL